MPKKLFTLSVILFAFFVVVERTKINSVWLNFILGLSTHDTLSIKVYNKDDLLVAYETLKLEVTLKRGSFDESGIWKVLNPDQSPFRVIIKKEDLPLVEIRKIAAGVEGWKIEGRKFRQLDLLVVELSTGYLWSLTIPGMEKILGKDEFAFQNKVKEADGLLVVLGEDVPLRLLKGIKHMSTPMNLRR